MATNVFRKLFDVFVSVLLCTMVVCGLLQVIPGDPATMLLGDLASPEDVLSLQKKLGLDLPWIQQWLGFLSSLLDGTWGESVSRGVTVWSLIVERFPLSACLAVSSLLFGFAVALSLALFQVYRRNPQKDLCMTMFWVILMSLPSLILSPILIEFIALPSRVLPVGGFDSPWALVLPTASLGIGMSAVLARLLRVSLMDHIGADWVRTATSKGLSSFSVLIRHVLPNSLFSILTMMGQIFGALLAGAVVTETLFDLPGMGKLLFSAFQSRDYPLVQGLVLWIALCYIVVSLSIDFVYSFLDPRVRRRSS